MKIIELLLADENQSVDFTQKLISSSNCLISYTIRIDIQ